MAVITLTVPDESLLTKVRNACLMIKGVASAKTHKTTKPLDMTQCADYRAAMDDIRAGRVTKWKDENEMFEKLGI